MTKIIIGTYNHDKFIELVQNDTFGHARATALNLFGWRGDAKNEAQEVDTQVSFQDLGAFPYTDIPEQLAAKIEALKEIDLSTAARELSSHIKQSPPYGWYAIVTDNDAIQFGKEINKEFDELFNIVVMDFQGTGFPEISAVDLREKRFQVYDDQTPKMWGW